MTKSRKNWRQSEQSPIIFVQVHFFTSFTWFCFSRDVDTKRDFVRWTKYYIGVSLNSAIWGFVHGRFTLYRNDMTTAPCTI